MLQLKEKGKTTIVEIEQIILMTCEGYITTIHISDDRLITVSKLLKKFEFELKDYGFIRANHYTLINPRYISTIHTGSKRFVTLKNGLKIRISRRKLFRFR